MYKPTYDEFKALATGVRRVPVYRTLISDSLTPISALARLRDFAGDGSYGFLLESVTGGEKIGRYSFCGVGPCRLVSVNLDGLLIDNASGDILGDGDPLDVLNGIITRDFKAAEVPGLPRFAGGAVGYFSYDIVRLTEHLPAMPPSPEFLNDVPDLFFMFFDDMLVFDHVNKTVMVVAHALIPDDAPSTGTLRESFDTARKRIDSMVDVLRRSDTLGVFDIRQSSESDMEIDSTFSKADFMQAVEKCKEYIAAGDIFQVVLSQRMHVKTKASPLSIYRALRMINPSPYMFFLDFGGTFQLIGASPEVMVRVENGTITVRPIAGTRRRGKDDADDAALAEELISDPKERAEHIMLVDLGRNDVGRVSEYGQVSVTEEMVIEKYSHVMHIVSNVEGAIRKNLSALDVLRSCLPAGTLSGAPKIRAMQIIDELEPQRRGPYGGAVGYVDFHGNLDTCIAIRTILQCGEDVYVQAGGGIVADSVPELEYEESRNKAKAALRSVRAAEQCLTESGAIRKS